MEKVPLLGKTLEEVQVLVRGLGMPAFTAKQIVSWLYDKKVTSIDEMTNLSLKNRELLKEHYEVGASSVPRKVILLSPYIYPTMTGLLCACPLRWAVR